MPDEARLIKRPDKIISYFKRERWLLAIITISGCIYNVGMTAGPWFEGQLAQYLCDIMAGNRTFQDMVIMAFLYVGVIFFVQAMRYVKRLYVRKFANHINRDMKQVLYRNLVHKRKTEFEEENAGSIMTKAISDVDTCVEGMRKFTTEIFDTGVVMIAYFSMLLIYDWRLTLLSMLFPPVAYLIAEKLKKPVSQSAAVYKDSAGKLNESTLDRISNAITYRVYGQEKNQDNEYERYLDAYEQKAIRANIWETAMQPIYRIISMIGVLTIIWFGGKNVMGNGWVSWDIAAFTTFLSCFTKLAVKSSKAAKLFNAVQKAEVSWRRIKPYMKETEPDIVKVAAKPEKIKCSHLSFSYKEGKEILSDVSFCVNPGEIIGVTGPVACGKSTFGRIFLCEYPFRGMICFGTKELRELLKEGAEIVGYMGHQPELLSDTIEENILLGENGDAMYYLRAVCMDEEVKNMPEGIHTKIGSGGVRLSGGQQARIALARTLCHKKPIMVLDDPFSAVDLKTEQEIMKNLKLIAGDSVVILLSHRLTMFSQMDQVFWIDEGTVETSTHTCLLEKNENYARLYRMQTEKGDAYETEK